jgi:hypothetical protein
MLAADRPGIDSTPVCERRADEARVLSNPLVEGSWSSGQQQELQSRHKCIMIRPSVRQQAHSVYFNRPVTSRPIYIMREECRDARHCHKSRTARSLGSGLQAELRLLEQDLVLVTTQPVGH